MLKVLKNAMPTALPGVREAGSGSVMRMEAVILTPELLKQIEAKLLERKQQLAEELDRYGKFEDFGRGEDENAAEIATYSDNLSLGQTLASALRDVNNALSRIASGTYGMCRYCNEPIPEKRLLARPTSSSCVKCKTEKKAL
ncbi:MAG: TraR/DksA family transcriptional regulator [bacterium]|nr:TraR/DksA family transcriptional regulator [bacterium]